MNTITDAEVLELQEFGLPDPIHVEGIMRGVEDTVHRRIDGNESLTLTGFQTYLGNVLAINGTTRFKDVEGNEGFFSSIGDGFQKAWDYVRKTFKSIWGFFFGDKTEKVLDGAEKDLKKAAETLNKEGGKNDKEPTDAEAEAMVEDISKIVKAKEAFLEKIKGLDIDGIKEKMPDIPDVATVTAELSKVYNDVSTKTKAFVDKHKDPTKDKIKKAGTIIGDFAKDVSELKIINTAFEKTRGKMEKILDAVEKTAKEGKEEKAKGNVTALRKLMVNSSQAAMYIRNTTGQMVSTAKKSLKAYGLAAVLTIDASKMPKAENV